MTARPGTGAYSGEAGQRARWRDWSGLDSISRAIVAWAATFFTVCHLYTAVYGAPETQMFLMLHLTLALVLAFLIKPLGDGIVARLIDLALCAAAMGILGYMLANLSDWDMRIAILTPLDYVTGIGLTLLVCEAVRRTVGAILLVVSGFFVLHALYANYFPGIFYGAPSTFESLLIALYIGDAGLFGVPLAVMANYVVLFILFGEVLTVCGAGTFMTRLAFALFGHRAGGPAKAAVVASGMMGSVSGSAIGNVLTTGAFTIPMMKKLGYRRDFAAGVEASASTGGMLMPPVMGAIAFMMADFMGVAYVEVALAAAIPALLYYWGIYWSVHFEAKKAGLRALARADLPSTRKILLQEGYLAAPLLVIIVALVLEWSIIFVALMGILSAALLSFVRRRTRLTPIRVGAVLQGTAKNTVSLSAAAACAGIIIAAIFSTGLSFRLSHTAVQAAGEHLWLILLLSAIMATILGMGMTASAVYITMVATVIPILRAAGIPEIAAHMFALYFGVISNITPPVALAAFAGASLSGANPISAGFQAARIGVSGFLVPFLFVYAPALLLIGSFADTLWVATTAALSLLCIAAAFTGYLAMPLAAWQRLLLAAASLLLIIPEVVTDAAGFALFLLVALSNWKGIGRREARIKAEREGPSSGWLARFAAARIRKEEVADSVPTGEILMREEHLPGGVDEFTRPSLYAGWALVALAMLAVGWVGEQAMHAIQPLWWIAALASISLAFATGLKLATRPVARPT